MLPSFVWFDTNTKLFPPFAQKRPGSIKACWMEPSIWYLPPTLNIELKHLELNMPFAFIGLEAVFGIEYPFPARKSDQLSVKDVRSLD